MNNIRYYEKDIKKFCDTYPDHAIARTKTGKFVPCSGIKCTDCIFKRTDEKCCATNKVLWFMEEKGVDNG